MIFKTTRGYMSNGKVAYKLFKTSEVGYFWFSVQGNIPWELCSAVKTAKLNKGSHPSWSWNRFGIKYNKVILHLMTWKKI